MPKSVTHSSRLLLVIIILAAFVGCDQATKQIATHSLSKTPPMSYFGDTFRLEYAENPGGFLSLGSQWTPELRRLLFIGLNAAVMIFVGAYLATHLKSPLVVVLSLTLILAGGIGNLIDRVWNQGLVTDFLNVGIGPLRSGVFNVADVAITLGATALIVCMLTDSEGYYNRKKEAGPSNDGDSINERM